MINRTVQCADFVRTHIGEEAVSKRTFHLQPITDIHLHSHLRGELAANGDVRYIIIFSAIAYYFFSSPVLTM